MIPATYQLKEVTVSAKKYDSSAQILKLAIQNIENNYTKNIPSELVIVPIEVFGIYRCAYSIGFLDSESLTTPDINISESACENRLPCVKTITKSVRGVPRNNFTVNYL